MNRERGFIKLWRSDMESELYREEPFTKWQALQDLKMRASFEPRTFFSKGETVSLFPGELITGEDELAKVWRWSRDRVHRFLERLKKAGIIIRTTSKRGTRITFPDWEEEQGIRTTDNTINRTTDRTRNRTSGSLDFTTENETHRTTNDTTNRTINRTTDNALLKNKKEDEEEKNPFSPSESFDSREMKTKRRRANSAEFNELLEEFLRGVDEERPRENSGSGNQSNNLEAEFEKLTEETNSGAVVPNSPPPRKTVQGNVMEYHYPGGAGTFRDTPEGITKHREFLKEKGYTEQSKGFERFLQARRKNSTSEKETAGRTNTRSEESKTIIETKGTE